MVDYLPNLCKDCVCSLALKLKNFLTILIVVGAGYIHFVVAQRQLWEVSSLLSWYESWGLSSGHQSWSQAPLPIYPQARLPSPRFIAVLRSARPGGTNLQSCLGSRGRKIIPCTQSLPWFHSKLRINLSA